jgi:hypothetical protein
MGWLQFKNLRNILFAGFFFVTLQNSGFCYAYATSHGMGYGIIDLIFMGVFWVVVIAGAIFLFNIMVNVKDRLKNLINTAGSSQKNLPLDPYEALLSIKGIGPKTAQNILAKIDADYELTKQERKHIFSAGLNHLIMDERDADLIRDKFWKAGERKVKEAFIIFFIWAAVIFVVIGWMVVRRIISDDQVDGINPVSFLFLLPIIWSGVFFTGLVWGKKWAHKLLDELLVKYEFLNDLRCWVLIYVFIYGIWHLAFIFYI